MVSRPRIGISLPTTSPHGLKHLLSYLAACARAASGADAAFILVAARHGETAQLQPDIVVPYLLDHAPTTTMAPIFIAPSWPTFLLVEHIASLEIMARESGATLIPVLASGRNEPVATAPENPGSNRGRATDLALTALEDNSIKPWIAAERGPALRRAARASGWISNAIYDRDQLERQISVVREVPARAVRRDILCHPDGDPARAKAKSLLARGYRNGMKLEHIIAGDAEECVRQMSTYGDLAFTHVVIRPMVKDPEEAAETITSVLTTANSLLA